LRKCFDCRFVHSVLLTHQYLKPPLAIDYDFELLLVLSFGYEWDVNLHGARYSLSFTLDAVHSSGALFDVAWIPAQIVMQHMAAVEVQIDTFGKDARRHENVGIEGSVEAEHQSLPSILSGVALDKTDVG